MPHIFASLYEHYTKPDNRPEDRRRIVEEEGWETAAADYVAGMSDRYAVAMYRELFIPKAWNN